ncbi:MAG: rhodanese-like domain-containing protein [Parcubacteria group bacterium]|jgi:rhodanese-related sulfurtransferase
MEKKENSQKVIVLGIGLIILVMVFTVVRPYIFKNKNNSASKEAPTQKTSDSMLEISGADLWQKINNKEKVKIIDVRDQESFNLSHIIDSQNFQAENLAQNIDSWDKNYSYVLVDDLGDPKMADLAQNIRSRGIKDVKYLASGIASWRNENRPVMTDGDPFSFDDQAKVQYITADDLKKGLEQKPNIIIIDLRKDQAFSEGHIKDSINIYLGDLEAKRKEIPSGKQVILVDNDGLWAFKGAVKLFDMGILNVLALTDGLDKWKEKGYEIVK